jgi:hypothetical protein
MWPGGDIRALKVKDLSAGEIGSFQYFKTECTSHHLDIWKRADLITFEKNGENSSFILITQR